MAQNVPASSQCHLRQTPSAKEDEEEFLERISKMLQEMTPDCEDAWILMGSDGDVVVET